MCATCALDRPSLLADQGDALATDFSRRAFDLAVGRLKLKGGLGAVRPVFKQGKAAHPPPKENPMNLIQRQDALLRYERDMLLANFQTWRNITTNDSAWQKHFSQVRRITAMLEPLAADAGNAAAEDDAATLNRQERQAKQLLFAQRTWDYFRSKLALRDLKDHRPMLQCADEFAWSCYRPAWEAARQADEIDANDLKEPPLVYLTGSATPFVQVRQGRYTPEGIGAEDARNYGSLLALPIPVIGLPWPQLKQTALVVTLAHEVGHAVDEDFDVGAAVDAAIGGLERTLGERGKAWLAWRRELFADVYGVLCAGPAHLIALSDYLLTTEDVVRAERVELSRLDKYPPRQLRILFNHKLLAEIGLAEIGLADVGVWQAWDELYPVRGMQDFDDYADDAGYVARALLHTPIPKFGGKSVKEVICMTAQEWAEVERRAAMLPAADDRLPWCETKHREAAETQSLFRLTFAAATLASYRAADPAAQAKKSERMIQTAVGWVPYGKRGPQEDRTADEALFAEQQAHMADTVEKLRRMALGE